jgi:ATP-dependent helicase/DNAse subunit B
LESYGTCPFQFFIKNALEAEEHELPVLGLDASQLGTILHRILELTYRKASNPVELESLLESLTGAAAEVFSTAPRDFGFRPSILWEVEQAQFLEKLKESIAAMAEDSEWQPFAYEAKFGLDGVDPLEIDLGEEILKLHGVIDRVDKNQQGELRVVDYKTGSSHLAPKDLQRGYRLQLPIYALAARDALDLGEPVDGIYWKIFAAEAGSLKLAKISAEEADGVEAAIEITRKHLYRILKGIRSAEYSPKKPDGGCPSYCVAAKLCWRFEPGA